MKKHDIISSLRLKHKKSTAELYISDVIAFSKWLGLNGNVDAAVLHMVQLGPFHTNDVLWSYKDLLIERGLSPQTINRNICSLRAMARAMRADGLVEWSIYVPSMPIEERKDMSGPPIDIVQQMLNKSIDRKDAKGTRDAAILQLLFNMILRRAEVVSLDFEHVVLRNYGSTLAVLLKGANDRSIESIPDTAIDSLRKWMDIHPTRKGALFVSLAANGSGTRMSSQSVYQLVRKYGADCGEFVRPNGLRHSAITQSLDEHGGRVREVQKLTRHKAPCSVLTYYDNKDFDGRDVAGEIAELLSRSLST